MSDQHQEDSGELVEPEATTPSPKQDGGSGASIRRLDIRQSQYIGPMLPPAMLADYEQIVPGSAERILGVFLTQSQHRQELEKRNLTHEHSRSWGGLIAGLIVALAVLGVAAFAIYKGQQAAAAIIASFELVSLVSVFIYGSHQRRAEREARLKHASGTQMSQEDTGKTS